MYAFVQNETFKVDDIPEDITSKRGKAEKRAVQQKSKRRSPA